MPPRGPGALPADQADALEERRTSAALRETLHLMPPVRIAALLLVANTAVFIAGMLLRGAVAGANRPIWLLPIWLRAGFPLAVAVGLWFGHRWAWWVAVAMCAVLLLWTGLASIVLAFGGYFTGDGVAFRAIHVSLLMGTWLVALSLLLFRTGRTRERA